MHLQKVTREIEYYERIAQTESMQVAEAVKSAGSTSVASINEIISIITKEINEEVASHFCLYEKEAMRNGFSYTANLFKSKSYHG